MGWLGKFGQIALKVLQVATGIVPIVGSVLPPTAIGPVQAVENDLALITQIIQSIEIVGQQLNLTGVQKLQGAAPLVSQVLMNSFLMANHKVANEAKYQNGINSLTSGMADILTSLEPHVNSQDKSA